MQSRATSMLEKRKGSQKKTADQVRTLCRVRPFDARELAISNLASSVSEVRSMRHGSNSSGHGVSNTSTLTNSPKTCTPLCVTFVDEPSLGTVPNATLRPIVTIDGRELNFLDKETFQVKETFTFDECLCSIPQDQVEQPGVSIASQETVFECVGEPTLENAWQGYNACIFAYGQTGSGKTHTMMGFDESDPGLIPRICQELFASIEAAKAQDAEEKSNHFKEYYVEAQFLEIYNENVQDLLWELGDADEQEANKWDRENLRVRNVPGMQPFVVGLSVIPVTSWDQCMKLIEIGSQSRAVGSTAMNERSSRSHCVFTITFKQVTRIAPGITATSVINKWDKVQTVERVSRIHLVDLAGSERVKKSLAEGQRLKEAAAINLSLTTLRAVIDALVEKRKVIPYRESQLTCILSETLGGNSKTFMMACVSPHADNADETLNTLRYAVRAQGIMCYATVNELDEHRRIADLQEQLAEVQRQVKFGLVEETEDLKSSCIEMQSTIEKLHEDAQKTERMAMELEEAIRKEKAGGVVRNFVMKAMTKSSERKMEEKAREKYALARRVSIFRRQTEEDHVVLEKKDQTIKDLENEAAALQQTLAARMEEVATAMAAMDRSLATERAITLDKNELEAKTRRRSQQINVLECLTHVAPVYLTRMKQRELEQVSAEYAVDRQCREKEAAESLAKTKANWESVIADHQSTVTISRQGIESLSRSRFELHKKLTHRIEKRDEDVAFHQNERQSEDAAFRKAVAKINDTHKRRLENKRRVLQAQLTQRDAEEEGKEDGRTNLYEKMLEENFDLAEQEKRRIIDRESKKVEDARQHLSDSLDRINTKGADRVRRIGSHTVEGNALIDEFQRYEGKVGKAFYDAAMLLDADLSKYNDPDTVYMLQMLQNIKHATSITSALPRALWPDDVVEVRTSPAPPSPRARAPQFERVPPSTNANGKMRRSEHRSVSPADSDPFGFTFGEAATKRPFRV